MRREAYIATPDICISYVTSVRYIAGINHEAWQRTEHGRDITNLCRHEPVVRGQVTFCPFWLFFARTEAFS